MRNQPGVAQEKAWPQLSTTLCLRKHFQRDNSASNDDSRRYWRDKRDASGPQSNRYADKRTERLGTVVTESWSEYLPEVSPDK